MLSLDSSSEKKMFECRDCNKVFTRFSNLKQHNMIHLNEKSFICDVCQKVFSRNSSLFRHLATHQKLSNSVDGENLIQDSLDSTTKEEESLKTPCENLTFSCSTCNKVFSTSSNLNQHIKIHQNDKPFQCDVCLKTFSRKFNLKQHKAFHDRGEQPTLKCDDCGRDFKKNVFSRHLKTHQNLSHHCKDCDKKFSTKFNLKQHMQTRHANSLPLIRVRKRTSVRQTRDRKSFESLGLFKTIYLEPDEEFKFDLESFFQSLRSELIEKIELEVDRTAIKWYLVIKLILEKDTMDGDVEIIDTYFHSDTYTQFTIDGIEDVLNEAFEKMKTSFEEFCEGGSNWQLREIIYLELKIARYNPLK